GRAGVGCPAVIARAIARQHRARLVRVAHAVNVERQAGITSGSEQEGFQLGGALAVAPVADPDQAFALLLDGWRVEQASVGGLVPRPDAVAPTPAAIHVGQRLPEREYAVIAGQIERADRVRIADRTV